MNLQRLFTILVMTFALALPTTLVAGQNEAHALGGVIKSSRSGGKRTHKRANAKRTKKKSTRAKRKSTKRVSTRTSARSSSRKVVSRTTRTTRPSRTTTRTRVVRTTSRRAPRRTTRVVRTSRPARTTHVHHHHHGSSTTVVRESGRTERESNVDVFFTGGLGVSGFHSPTISDQALPGIGYNVAVGAKGDLLGFELGLDGGGFTFDETTGGTDIAFVGIYGDLKLQPTFDVIEPYAFVGVGGYSLGDGVLDEASGGAALRAGLGANLRFDDFALGGKYTYQAMNFTDDSGLYGGNFGAASETLALNLTFYF